MLDNFIWEDERAIGCGTMLELIEIPCGTVVPRPDPFEAFVINLDPLLCENCNLAEEQRLLAKIFPERVDSV